MTQTQPETQIWKNSFPALNDNIGFNYIRNFGENLYEALSCYYLYYLFNSNEKLLKFNSWLEDRIKEYERMDNIILKFKPENPKLYISCLKSLHKFTSDYLKNENNIAYKYLTIIYFKIKRKQKWKIISNLLIRLRIVEGYSYKPELIKNDNIYDLEKNKFDYYDKDIYCKLFNSLEIITKIYDKNQNQFEFFPFNPLYDSIHKNQNFQEFQFSIKIKNSKENIIGLFYDENSKGIIEYNNQYLNDFKKKEGVFPYYSECNHCKTEIKTKNHFKIFHDNNIKNKFHVYCEKFLILFLSKKLKKTKCSDCNKNLNIILMDKYLFFRQIRLLKLDKTIELSDIVKCESNCPDFYLISDMTKICDHYFCIKCIYNLYLDQNDFKCVKCEVIKYFNHFKFIFFNILNKVYSYCYSCKIISNEIKNIQKIYTCQICNKKTCQVHNDKIEDCFCLCINCSNQTVKINYFKNYVICTYCFLSYELNKEKENLEICSYCEIKEKNIDYLPCEIHSICLQCKFDSNLNSFPNCKICKIN